ncbi:MAG TPA: hypothetical protein VK886_22285 [Vicinamibacterales bacterium]|nr:hypothetical protein [Vicinamibacterales bacterium]
MNEEAVRALVREVVSRHLGAAPGSARAQSVGPAERAHQYSAPRLLPLAWHASHARHNVLSGEESDGPCFIEPAVRCNHCGYCQSHGH